VYRAHQVFHNYIIEEIQIIGPVCLSCVELITIVFIYGTIRLGASVDVDLFLILNVFFVSLVCLVVLEIILQFAHQITQHSELLSKQQYFPDGRGPTKEDERFMKSCRPLKWKIGVFTVTRNTFPTILNNIVIQSVIDLLIFM